MKSVKKRVCQAQYKKWNDRQVVTLINYLKENRPLEKPTAQRYYTRFLELNACTVFDWKHVRDKVRNMRKVYNSTKSMLNATGAGAMEGETIEDVMLTKCPQFHHFDEIFGYRDDTIIATIVDTGNENTETLNFLNEQSNAEEPETTNNLRHPVEMEVRCNNAEEEILPSSSSSKESTKAKETQKGIYSRTGLADVLKVQGDILQIRKSSKEAELKLREEEIKIQREKLVLEKEKQERELSLEKEKMSLEKEKLKIERKIRFMEMKVKKEIALKEIEMKERVEMEKLKKIANLNE